VLCIAEVGEGFLEILNHGTTNKAGSPDHLLKDLCQFLLKLNVWSHKI
jgi:hypothetical protein